jgi:Rod binding domain-containing protein
MISVANSYPAASARPDGAETSAPANLAKQAQDFEAVFIGKLVNTMLETVEKDSFSDSNAESAFQGLMGEQIGNSIAVRGGIGLAPSVLAQLIRLQGNAHD